MASPLNKDQRLARTDWIMVTSRTESDQCIIWPHSRDTDGYPVPVSFQKRQRVRPNKIMCELKRGPAPTETHQAAHTCGNGRGGCINPNHLYWATPAENCADRKLHGTDMVGSMQSQAKINEDDVRVIKVLLAQRIPQRTIAKQYGVSQAVINYINVGRNWTHVR